MTYNEKLLFASGGRSNYRIPSLVVTNDGTVLAFCNDRKDSLKNHAEETALVYARKVLGGEWSEVRTVMGHEDLCCLIGSAVYDREEDKVLVSVTRKFAKNEFGKLSAEELERIKEEDAKKAKEMGIELGEFQLVSTDSGESFAVEKMQVEPYVFTHIDGNTVSAGTFTHGGAHGIQLRHAEHRGRLLCPSRIFAGRYENWVDIRNYVYNNAIYSDDHGKSWHVSAPVQLGTGEGTLVELSNGDIFYNSRAYFGDRKRYLATSRDGGATYSDFCTDDFLLEEARMGCNASFLRVERDELGEELAAKYLPNGAEAITLFVNPRSEVRRNMSICVSFDDGKSWKVAKTVYEDACAYSSLDFSLVDKHFYLIYEKGTQKPYSLGISALEFDLEWLFS